MGDVVKLHCISYLPLPVSTIIDEIPHDLGQIIVIGLTATGELYFASSEADGGAVLWQLEMAKRALIDKALELERGA